MTDSQNNNSVYKTALEISIIILILGAAEFICFTLFMKFHADILFGVIYGCAFSVLNFFYLAFCVNKSVTKSQNAAKAFMAGTYTTRILLTAAMIIIAIKIDAINIWAAVIPLFFQRIAVFLQPLYHKKRGDNT